MPDISKAIEAYKEACDQWTGCDWPVDVANESLELTTKEAYKRSSKLFDLSRKAWEVANSDNFGAAREWLQEEVKALGWQANHFGPPKDFYAPDWSDQKFDDQVGYVEWLADEYLQVASYLEGVAEQAEEAEWKAGEAVEALEKGDYDYALQMAEEACGIEQQYGDCPTWRAFREAVREVVEASEGEE